MADAFIPEGSSTSMKIPDTITSTRPACCTGPTGIVVAFVLAKNNESVDAKGKIESGGDSIGTTAKFVI